MVKVKICGIRKNADALWAANLGADMLGFVFYDKSPRKISPRKAREIIQGLPPFIIPVGVFVNEEIAQVKKITRFCMLKAIQLHGEESAQYVKQLKDKLSDILPVKIIKAFRLKDGNSLEQIAGFTEARSGVDFYLLDTYKEGVPGGSGETFNWELAIRAKEYGSIILSGGLNPENIMEAIKQVQPFAVDVSSGLEISPGRKDYEKMKSFIKKAKSLP